MSYCEPVAVGLDASRFDQHVSVEALEYEHSYYNSVFGSSELAMLLKWQLYNVGKGIACDGSVAYNVDGCRMSGDINTSMGNCFIMSSIVLGYFEHCGLRAHLANNGDDCVVICEKRDVHKLDHIGDWFLDFGFRLTIEPKCYVFERVEFCQSQPILTGNGYRMVRNPYVAVSKDVVSLLPWNCELEFDRWRSAIGVCGLELTRGVPFWESFYRRFGADHQHLGSISSVVDSGLGYMAKGVLPCAITQEARYSFWLGFGMKPDEQIALESMAATMEYGDGCKPLIFGEITNFSKLLDK